MKLISLLLVLSIWLVGCGNSKHQESKGGVWDETENGVAVLVSDSDGNPVANARVRLVPQQSWAADILADNNPVTDSTVTDENGQALLHTSSWPAYLELESAEGVGRDLIFAADSGYRATLGEAARLEGSLQASAHSWPESLRIAGTSYVAKVDENGAFLFPNLPRGEYTLVHVSTGEIQMMGTTQIKEASVIRLDSLRPTDTDSVLIDDFEDQISANRFHVFTSKGWWYLSSDSLSAIDPSSISDALTRTSQSWEGGQSLHVRFTIDTTFPGKFALCGFDLGESQLVNPQSATYDLSGVDSISFWAKGSGTISFQAGTILPSMEVNLLSVKFTLSPAWTRVVIYPDSFAHASNLYTWDDLSLYLNAFNFMSNQDADLWLDQIQLHGISATDLYSTLLRKEP